MRAGDAEEAEPGDLVEAVDCSWGGEIAAIDAENGEVEVRIDDPRFSGWAPGEVEVFRLDEVELVMRCDE